MMPSQLYDNITKPNASWICSCGTSNYSTHLSDSFSIESSNSYEVLSTLTDSNITDSFNSLTDLGSPQATSSPKKPNSSSRGNSTLKVLNVNFQSVKAKKASFWNVIDSLNPDVIIGSETWLKPEVSNAEILPPDYTTYRRDRPN
jgi:hypothetical protein